MQLVEKYKPRALDEFAGIKRARTILGHFARTPYASAWLLTGPSGIGKTTLALALTELIGGQTHHIPSRACDLETVERTVESCYYRPMGGGDFNFVIVDEADQMTKAAQHAFLSKLDTTAPPPDTIFFFTANSTAGFEDRFLSRCRHLALTHDGLLDEGSELLARIWEAETNGNSAAPNFERMLEESRLNVRAAIMELEMEIIARGAEANSPGGSGEIIDSYDLAKVWGIDVATIYKRVAKGKMPPPCKTKPRMAWLRSEVLAAA